MINWNWELLLPYRYIQFRISLKSGNHFMGKRKVLNMLMWMMGMKSQMLNCSYCIWSTYWWLKLPPTWLVCIKFTSLCHYFYSYLTLEFPFLFSPLCSWCTMKENNWSGPQKFRLSKDLSKMYFSGFRRIFYLVLVVSTSHLKSVLLSACYPMFIFASMLKNVAWSDTMTDKVSILLLLSRKHGSLH